MNNPIKQAFDKRLADIRMDEAKMNRILSAEKPKTPRPRAFRKALVLALALVVIAGAAYSASQFLGTVDWRGNKTPEELELTLTYAPDNPEDMEAQRLERLSREMLRRKPPEELWLARTENGGWLTFFPKTRVKSFEEAKKLLAGSASPLMLPDSVPAEYAFNGGELSLYINTPNYEILERLPDETPEPGLTLRGYRLPRAAMGDYSGYTLHFINKNGDALRLQAQMTSGNENFGLWQGDNVKTLAVPGFDNALLFERKGWNQLFLQQTGFDPISACRMDYFTMAPDRPDYPLEPEVFTSITYTLHANADSGEALSGEALMALAGEYGQ